MSIDLNEIKQSLNDARISGGGPEEARLLARATRQAIRPGGTVDSLVAEVERLQADNERLRAKNDELTEDYVPMISSDFLTVQGGVVTLTMKGARRIVTQMAESMVMMLDDVEATNYIEMDAQLASGKRYSLRVQRYNHPTPHDLRLQAEAERDALRDEVERLQAANPLNQIANRDEIDYRDYPEVDY